MARAPRDPWVEMMASVIGPASSPLAASASRQFSTPLIVSRSRTPS
jgi:hypothetical protein